MIRNHFKYELKVLLRNRWIQLLAVIIFSASLFAGYNGNERVSKRISSVEKGKIELAEKDNGILKKLDSVKKGLEIQTFQSSLMYVGMAHARIAEMKPKSLAFTAVGQSDLFTHYVRPSVMEEEYLIDYTEMSNPVQRLLGSFDLAFVIIYLLPLIIIAFTYNILSGERESGSLKLLASQPVSVFKWTLQKTIFRFAILFGITLLALVVTFLFFDFSISGNIVDFLQFVLLVFGYMLFWFAVAILSNFLIASASKNASVLLGFWVLFVLLLPAIANQFSTSLYPVPSRTKLLNEVRELKAETAKKQDEILDSYLRDHPEYAASENNSNSSYFQKYMASQKLVREEIAPVVKDYDDQLEKQQKLVSRFQYASPAILMQQGLNDLAGTATADYGSFRKQVSDFAEEWREFFLPLLYTNTEFTASHFKQLPRFEFTPRTGDSIWLKGIVLLFISILILGFSAMVFKRKVRKGELIL